MTTKKELRQIVKGRRALLTPEEERENSEKILSFLISLRSTKKQIRFCAMWIIITRCTPGPY